jgi:hypothetical protein
VVTNNFTHSIFDEQEVEKRGEEIGSWIKKVGKIMEHSRAFLDHFGAEC